MYLFSDVSGGQAPSIMAAMRSALTATNNLSIINSNSHCLDYKDVFHLATLEGAACKYKTL